MSEYKVPYTTITNITPHNNAERLEVATVYGWQVIIQKNKYKVGDKVVYVPIDSILTNQKLEDSLFPVESKIKLNKHRIRQIKIRGLASQGMLINPEEISSFLNMEYVKLEEDVKDFLGIIKYDPPEQGSAFTGPNPRNKPKENPLFHKYNGIDNVKWFPNYFDEKEVIIQEKLHGSNCRAAYLKASANTPWKKFLKLIRLLPKYEYCYGSNNVQLQHRGGYTGFYGEDVYGNVLKKVDAFSKLKPGETIFGELIGDGIQKNYNYGFRGHNNHHFVLFDVKVEKEDGSQEFLNPEEVEAYAKERGFDFVPVLYRGIYNKDFAYSLTKGSSVYCPDQKVREGVVIKLKNNYSENSHKHALKWLNEDYLSDESNTDNH